MERNAVGGSRTASRRRSRWAPDLVQARFRSKAAFPSCEVAERESPAPKCREVGNAIRRVPQENGISTATEVFVALSLSIARTGRAMAPVPPLRDLSRGWWLLFDVCQRGIESNNICAEILAIGSFVLIRTTGEKLVIPAVAIVEISEFNISDGFWKHVLCRPL